jgi:hypothetical protein
MAFAASPAQVWNSLMFYEEVSLRPPLLLRLLLPEPVRVEGRKSAVGAEARCLYRQGQLLKRVTRIDPERRCDFEVVEQGMAIPGGIRLAGGRYALTASPDGGTRVELETRYFSPLRPRWLAGPVEAAICHAFHRHILEAMRRTLEAAPAGPARDRWPCPPTQPAL